VIHTSEGATTFTSLGNFLADPSREVSYHVGFDDTTDTSIGEYVKPPHKSWSAHQANNLGEHGCCCTPSGASRNWTRDDWLARPKMLSACRQWLAEESARYGIPLVKITPGQIAAGYGGVCGHRDCVEAGLGGTHTDPGVNFPYDVVLGTTPTPPEPEPEEPEMWSLADTCPPGTDRNHPGVLYVALPQGRKSATVQLYAPCDPKEGVSCWGAQCLNGKKHGLWGGGNTWEMWLNGSKPFLIDLGPSCYAIELHHMGGTKAPLAVSVAGT
jgi:hypothetical protein